VPGETDFLRILWDADLQQLMLVACPDGIIVTDGDDRVILYTGASEQIFGFAPVEVLNREAAMVFDSEAEYRQFHQGLLTEGSVANTELTAVRKGGERFPAAVSASLLRDRFGGVLGTVIYIRDHTQLYGIQSDLRDKNRALNEMVATLDHVARHDSLTSLLRRSSAFEEAEVRLRDCLVAGKPFSVALFDLDRFKAVNDSHGHFVGDQVLAQLAHVLGDTARQGDIVGRFGGEEFIAFLPGADYASVISFAERVRAAIGACEIAVEGGGLVKVTVSGGIATIPRCAGSLESAIHLADNRLLAAKRQGRNRIVADGEHDKRHAA
jgi:diguanylate cyclase (GGDEF)-like protein/PAS domain S-box-containing protein